MLIEAAAEACVVSALSIIERKLSVPAQAVFDLIAWTGIEAAKLDHALVGAGSTIRGAKIIPAIRVEGADVWSSVSEISVWPEGQFSVLKASEVARYVCVDLVSSVLDQGRLGRLEQIAARVYLTLKPSQDQFAEWTEGFSRSLLERKVAPRTWSRFYDDVANLR